MKNWAGNLEFHPEQVLAPASTQEVQQIVQSHLATKKTIRMRGSAHSWTGLISNHQSFLHLDQMQGILHVDQKEKIITAKAGTKLHRFGEEAFKHKLSLPNQGDVDAQSLAGALSTGTHGTGITLQSMANQIEALTMVTGTGEILSVSRNSDPQMLKGMAVSFGSLGIITEVSLQMVDAYKLKVETFPEDMNTALERSRRRLEANRHIEMFYFPVGDWSLVKLMNQTNEVETKRGIGQKFNDVVLENWLYEALNKLAVSTNSYHTVDKVMRKFVSPKTFVNSSHLAFPTERTVRFMEMEYNLPADKFEEVFSEIKWAIKKNGFKTLFPIEIRFVKGDDLWLSPAHGRDSVYFAIHTYISEDWQPYFRTIENIFKSYGARPHWGKWHSQNSESLQKIYPKWGDFQVLRKELDPQGLWLNEHLKSLFYNSK